MKFEIRCIYLFTLLLVVIVHTLTANDALSHKKHRRQKRAFVEDLKCKQDIIKNGMSLIKWGIEKITNRTANLQGGFFESLRLVFNEMQRNKSATKSIIEEGLKSSYPEAHTSLVEKINVSESLESALIWLYTKDNTSSAFYKSVNDALSNHNCTFTEPTKQSQDQAAYTTALLATLLYWKDVKGYSGVTYRMIGNVSDIVHDLKKFQKGSNVVFPAFTSSSSNQSVAYNFSKPFPKDNILLVMDNSQPSLLRPRDIKDISQFPTEKECLYPSLAEFKVMSYPMKKTIIIYPKKISYYEVKLQLVGDGYISVNTGPVQGSVYLRVFAILIFLMYM